MDLLALWGALTGTTGAGVALRRERLARRLDLALTPGVNFTTSRVEPVGTIIHGWACVALWNKGGRSLAVERAGFRYMARVKGTDEIQEMRAAILLEEPIEMTVDGPTRKVYTPLGPLLATGVNPFDILEAFAITVGGREWFSPPQPLIQSIPPVMSADLLRDGLQRLRDDAEKPPVVGNEVGLKEEQPLLPESIPDLLGH